MIPVVYQWNGEAMVPQRRFMTALDKEYVIGENYTLIEHHDRSQASHSHFFAALHEGWTNLPEDQAVRFPTSEHLRKWCLIRAGYRDERSIVCASKAEAQRVAAFMRPMDDFAVVVVSEAVVSAYTAKSQSMRAMGKKDFQESKDAVLTLVSEMIGVAPAQLENQQSAQEPHNE